MLTTIIKKLKEKLYWYVTNGSYNMSTCEKIGFLEGFKSAIEYIGQMKMSDLEEKK